MNHKIITVLLAGTVMLPATHLFAPNGSLWDLNTNTGMFEEGSGDAFDWFGGLRVEVNGNMLLADWEMAGGLVFDGGQRHSSANPLPFEGLNISRSVFSSTTNNYTRFIDSFTNTTGGSITFLLTFGGSPSGNLGSDAFTTLVSSSNGVVDFLTEWILTIESATLDPNDISADSPVAMRWRNANDTTFNGLVNGNGTSPDLLSLASTWNGSGDDSPAALHSFTLAAGETVRFAFFLYQGIPNSTGADLLAEVNAFDEMAAFADLSAGERAQIANFAAPPTTTTTSTNTTTSTTDSSSTTDTTTVDTTTSGQPMETPEPGTLAMMGTALVGALLLKKRMKS
jgi:hypothetical protein